MIRRVSVVVLNPLTRIHRIIITGVIADNVFCDIKRRLAVIVVSTVGIYIVIFIDRQHLDFTKLFFFFFFPFNSRWTSGTIPLINADSHVCAVVINQGCEIDSARPPALLPVLPAYSDLIVAFHNFPLLF